MSLSLEKRHLVLMYYLYPLGEHNSLKEGSQTSHYRILYMGKDATKSAYLAYMGVESILFRTAERAVCSCSFSR